MSYNFFRLQLQFSTDNQLLIEMVKKYSSNHRHYLHAEQVLS